MANLQIIKELASAKNMTLDQLSRSLGITPQALSKIMRENSTKIDTLERIANVLGVPVAVFFETKSCEKEQEAKESHSYAQTEQTTYGDNSPNVNGDNNQLGDSANVAKALSEIAEHRKLLEKALGMLEKRDGQVDRMLEMMNQLITK